MRRLLPLLLVLSAQAALGADDLRLVLERKSLTATWRTYHQFIDGFEVIGTAVVERVDADGSVREVARDVTRGGPAPMPAPRALSIHGGKLVLVNVNGEARPAWRTVVTERPL